MFAEGHVGEHRVLGDGRMGHLGISEAGRVIANAPRSQTRSEQVTNPVFHRQTDVIICGGWAPVKYP